MIARDSRSMLHKDRFDHLKPAFLNSYASSQMFVDLKLDDLILDSVTDEQILAKLDGDFKRISEIISNARNDYVIFLEADSKVNSRIRTSDFVDMDCLSANSYPDEIIEAIELDSGRSLGVKGWGFVTGYVTVNCLRGMYDWFHKNPERIIKYFHIDRRFAHGDYYMPLVAHLAGFNIGNLGQVAECLRDSRRRVKRSPLVHQYRRYYS
jgi:hypothetical protein